jgi:hypothetical protein
VSLSERLHHSLWNHRVTADNPHGFRIDALARLRAIEDPTEREKEEKKVLADRNRRQRSDEVVARIRDRADESYRLQKINAGYVRLIAGLMTECLFVFTDIDYFIHFRLATTCSHATLLTGVSVYLTTTRVDTVRSRSRRSLMQIH